MKIAVAGTGYVGLSIAVLASQTHEVTAIDVIREKVDLINNRISHIKIKFICQHILQLLKFKVKINFNPV